MQKFSSFGRKKKQTKIRHRMDMLRRLQLWSQRCPLLGGLMLAGTNIWTEVNHLAPTLFLSLS